MFIVSLLVIRQKVIPGIPKCDPVTLYHQYKEEWSKYNIPGENRRSDLRWAVRERLVGTTSRVSNLLRIFYCDIFFRYGFVLTMRDLIEYLAMTS